MDRGTEKLITDKLAKLIDIARYTKANNKFLGRFGSTKKMRPRWYRKAGEWQVGAWEDHLSVGDGAVFSEPYDLSMRDCKRLIDFCEAKKLSFHITGLSSYYPGRTILICIEKKKLKGDVV